MKTFLIVAGVFAVLALVGVSLGRLIPNALHAKKDQALVPLAQEVVDKAAKSVEFYKIEYGHYPRTLEALTRRQPLIDIADPVKAFKMDPKLKLDLQYQRIGDKYTLYSVGADGIPHTEDDIYPSNFPDTSNFGWIKDP